MAKQAKGEPHGFAVPDANRRLEDWFLENVAAPLGLGLAPADRTNEIRMIAMDLWIGHAQWHWSEDEGHMQRLGVALAVLEICAHEVTLREMKDAEPACQADPVTCSSASPSPARTLAKEIAASPLSRAALNQSGGRPRNLLADAVAQQLRAGGFTQAMIAKFMGSTEGATRWRCKAKEARSLANFLGASP
jgi:hypothetical protein